MNLGAPIILTRACLPLLEASRGTVVFVLDDPARVTKALWGAYGVAKHALEGAVRQLALECEHNGVRVQGFRPPPMRTGLRAKAYLAEDPATLAAPDEQARACLRLLVGADSVSRVADTATAAGAR